MLVSRLKRRRGLWAGDKYRSRSVRIIGLDAGLRGSGRSGPSCRSLSRFEDSIPPRLSWTWPNTSRRLSRGPWSEKPLSRSTPYPIETSSATSLGERIGALVITIAPGQPAPLYTSESDVPDQAVVRILLEQLISPKQADRDDPLVSRRRDIVALLGSLNGLIP